jgi:hypothetical protein
MARVIMTITVDWEGIYLEPRDLNAMKAFYAQLEVLQKSFGASIPITHFICVRYFTGTDIPSQHEKAQKLIKSVLRTEDEIGAHVHCWKSLLLASNIKEKDIKLMPVGQDFDPPEYVREGNSGTDIGYQVPFGAYSESEITRVLDTTQALLVKYLGLKSPPVSFRCGCWVTCDVLFRALVTAGLRNDASAVPFNYINNVIIPTDGGSNLTDWLTQIWGNTKQTGPDPWVSNQLSYGQYPNGILGMTDAQISEPRMVNGIVEVPDSAMLLPWANQRLMEAHIDTAFDIAEKQGKDVYISLGFHQETCGEGSNFAPKNFPLYDWEKDVQLNGILGAVTHAITKSLRTKVEVEFIQKSSLAERYRLQEATGKTDLQRKNARN